ncbi:hypothetical protein BUY85_09360 [Staphylococcus equorum]|uniref:hypothetical protein n=1 Tax=Staphylococcus equorum TaxID=246432 RepID=UPI000D1C2B67|nr:hypothetical protein [Staphylococcus equorum]PTE77983.1 hypothetical protein BUY85_09360 [Staphylococcus equorum]
MKSKFDFVFTPQANQKIKAMINIIKPHVKQIYPEAFERCLRRKILKLIMATLKINDVIKCGALIIPNENKILIVYNTTAKPINIKSKGCTSFVFLLVINVPLFYY